MNKFVKMDKSLLNYNNDRDLVEKFTAHLGRICPKSYEETTNIENLVNAPCSTKNILYAWFFYCDLGSGPSFYEYLLNNEYFSDEYLNDEYLLKILFTLRQIGFMDLADRFESGIKLMLNNKSFTSFHNPDYLSKLTLHIKYDTLEQVDNNLSSYFDESYISILAKYIRLNESSLFI